MSVFEHLMTLGSFILALGVASILSFASTPVHRRREVRLSAPVLLWAGAIFLHQIVFWLAAYQFQATQAANYMSIGFVVAQPLLLYLQSATVVTDASASLDLPAHHARNARVYIALVALSTTLDIAFFAHLSVLEPEAHLSRIFASMGVALASSLAALAFQRQRWIQIGAPAAHVALQTSALYYAAKPLMLSSGLV